MSPDPLPQDDRLLHGRRSAPGAESALIDQVRAGDGEAFEKLFRLYYNPLCAFATSYVRNKDLAEELVEAVFARIWQQRERWEISTNLRAYLYTAVRYQVLDFRRHAAAEDRMRERSIRNAMSPGQAQAADPHEQCEEAELDTAIREAIEHLPERCRLVFTLRWQHHQSYAEIAATLGIAVKTVETQISRALKSLRVRLQSYR